MKKTIALLLVLLMMSLMTGCTIGAGNKNTSSRVPVPGVAMSTMSFGPEQDVTPEDLKGKVTVMNVAPYTGIYMEAGPTNKSREENVYALKITNTSTETIMNAVLVYNDGKQNLNFLVEMLPAGKSVYVVELTKKQAVSTKLTFVQGAVNYLSEGVEDMDSVKITPNRDFSLTVKNLTDKEIPCVWIFYRKVLEDGTFLGGRTLSTLCETILPGEELDVQAEFWQYNSCDLVNVLLLDKVPDFSEADTSSK